MRMISKRLFSLLSVAALGIALLGCDSAGTDTGGELSTDEAKTRVQSVDRDLSADLSELNTGAFSTTMQGLFSSDGSTNSKDGHLPLGYVLLDSLDNVIQMSDGRLDFQASTGEYNWDSENGWTSAGSSSSIVLNFPTSRGASNTATFELAGYSDTNVTIDGDSEYIPELIAASLTVGGDDVFAVDLSNTAFYDGQVNGTQVPKSFLLSVLTAPQRHTFELSSPSTQEFEFAFDLVKPEEDNQLVLGLLTTATLKNDFQEVSGAEDVDELSGTLNVGPNVAIEYSIQVDELAALGDDPSTQEVNDNFTGTMMYQDQKVGDIELTDQEGPVLVYNNGDEVPLAQVFDNTLSTFTQSASGTATAAMKTAADKVRDAMSTVFRP